MEIHQIDKTITPTKKYPVNGNEALDISQSIVDIDSKLQMKACGKNR